MFTTLITHKLIVHESSISITVPIPIDLDIHREQHRTIYTNKFYIRNNNNHTWLAFDIKLLTSTVILFFQSCLEVSIHPQVSLFPAQCAQILLNMILPSYFQSSQWSPPFWFSFQYSNSFRRVSSSLRNTRPNQPRRFYSDNDIFKNFSERFHVSHPYVLLRVEFWE